MRLSLFLLFVASPAFAKPFAEVTEEDVAPKSEILASAAGGELLPWSVAARHVREGLLLKTYGGYDTATSTPMMIGSAELTVLKRLTFRALATNNDTSVALKPTIGMLYDVLLEEDYGLDLAVGGDYEFEGWNHLPALVTHVAAATTAGETRLQANAAFGLATQGGERYGDLRLSGLHPVAQQLYAGLDTRARIDLERSMPEPVGELDWDVQAGPIATLALGRFALSATGGVSAYKMRSRDTSHVGAMGALGLGAAF